MFDPESFMREITPQVREAVKGERVVAAVSGGVDSTTAAVLMYKILGANVIPVMIDTGFLRKGEAEKVRSMLRGILPLEIIDKSEDFVRGLEGLSDAEEKRKKFRDMFYDTISQVVKEKGATFLVQGTIAADWVETQGGIKTQHNVLVQLGIDTQRKWGFKLIEPLADLYKDEVRALARYLGLPKEISERQPFPGPGLLVRVVGELTKEKLEIEREANEIVEEALRPYGYSQYFSAIFESEGEPDEAISKEVGRKVFIYKAKATGVKGDVRSYGRIASIEGDMDYEEIRRVVSSITKYDVTHVMWKIAEKGEGRYTVAIRAVVTEDFMTADFAKVERSVLEKIGSEILKIKQVKEVVYDVTSKPPATIELE